MCTSGGFAQNQWAWMGGENNYTPAGYGIKGVADSANRPSIRTGAASWTDASGNFWMFGGNGFTERSYGYLNDLWKYDLSKKWWTWVSGDSVSRQNAVYGTRGVASPYNKPGAFAYAVSWKDASGNFWMYSNVLWKYNPSINQWAWINGDTAVLKAVYGIKGIASAANKPGTINSVEWTDASGNFWLYGNVLWKYNLSTDRWIWVHGDTVKTTTVYGLKGVPNSINTPGTRENVTAWTDASGKFWLFGGYGTVSTAYNYGLINYNDDNLNDLWNYDPATNLWTWVHGDTVLNASGAVGTISIAAPGNRPGARLNAVSWTDASGNFWLFGGYKRYVYSQPSGLTFNDLWKYDRARNLWTCYNTTSYNVAQDSFSVRGVESPNTKPGSRYGATGWIDTSGSLWMFGGQSYDQNPNYYTARDAFLRYNPKTNLWSLERENTDLKHGKYGQKGVADAVNIPGVRIYASSWTDTTGNFWLFGGYGYSSSGLFMDFLNDLWKRDTANKWTWVSGSNLSNDKSQHGTKGIASPANVPSATFKSVTWRDANNNLWLFGGSGYLWNFNIHTNQWTWMSGDSTQNKAVYGIKGQPAAANKPLGINNAVSWIDKTGRLWLFGDNIWNYDPSINQWTWVSGDSTVMPMVTYGNLSIPAAANTPGARRGAVCWTDTTGNVWIFGGYRNGANNILNDLWKYNMVTNLWTWVSGDSMVNQKGVYAQQGVANAANKPGGRYDAVSWMDATGKLWLFGGIPTGGTGYFGSLEYYLNDLWNYDTVTNLWTWISGDSSINKNGIAGTVGTANTANKPGSRAGSVAWKDKAGNLWLMGGKGYGVKGNNFLNDIWKFTPAAPAPLIKFIYFSATAQNKAVLLNWQTSDDLQNAYYAILRSRDSVSYDSTGIVTTTGNGSVVSTYAFTDPHPFSDVNYYRIKYVDKTGKNTYSIVRKVMIDSAGLSYTIAQNPVTDELRIYIQAARPVQLQVEVRDAAGHLLIRQNQQITRGNTSCVIPVKRLAAGTYFIFVTSGATSITRRFVKL